MFPSITGRDVEGVGQDQATFCIDSVRKFTASSILFGDFNLILRFILFLKNNLKDSQ